MYKCIKKRVLIQSVLLPFSYEVISMSGPPTMSPCVTMGSLSFLPPPKD